MRRVRLNIVEEPEKPVIIDEEGSAVMGNLGPFRLGQGCNSIDIFDTFPIDPCHVKTCSALVLKLSQDLSKNPILNVY